jgi:DNA (cytosine-5)-methyltransferase 1
VSQLVLSLFPGIGLLDMAFEEEGFCVVRGPDLLWGGDVKRFHPPAGKFDGVIGGPPCQAFSRLRHIVRANGHRIAENLIPEFVRCVEEAQPSWFTMENVPDAPEPCISGYDERAVLLDDVSAGGETSRLRRFTFGCSGWGSALYVGFHIETLALWAPDPARAVVCDAREVPVKMLKGGRPKGGGRMPHVGKAMPWARRCELQGLPDDFLKDAPFTAAGKNTVLGNGVPLPMGRAVARAVKRALGIEAVA